VLLLGFFLFGLCLLQVAAEGFEQTIQCFLDSNRARFVLGFEISFPVKFFSVLGWHVAIDEAPQEDSVAA